jgi:hypothetical protein
MEAARTRKSSTRRTMSAVLTRWRQSERTRSA